MSNKKTIGSGATAGQQIYGGSKALAYGIPGSNGDYSRSTIKITPSAGGSPVEFYATSIPVQAAGDLKEYRDNTGRVCAIVIPEATQTINMTGYLLDGTAQVIKKGDKVNFATVGGQMQGNVEWLIQDFSINWQNEDVANVSCTVKAYDFG